MHDHVFNMEYLDMFKITTKWIGHTVMCWSAWLISDLCDFIFFLFSIKITTIIYRNVQLRVVIFVVIWSEEWIAVDLKRHFFQVVPYLSIS